MAVPINGACHSVKIALKVSVARLGDILDFGQLFKASGKINLPQSSPFLGNFCKGVKIIHFSSDTIFGQLLYTFGDFYLVTLAMVLVVVINQICNWKKHSKYYRHSVVGSDNCDKVTISL